MKKRSLLVALCLCGLNETVALPPSATWRQTPVSDLWSDASNWQPAVVPQSVATFESSSITSLRVFGPSTQYVSRIIFSETASAFSMEVRAGWSFFGGVAVANASAHVQRFTIKSNPLRFYNNANAGAGVLYVCTAETPAEQSNNCEIYFWNSASAGSATFINEGSSVPEEYSSGGHTFFFDTASAGNASFENMAAAPLNPNERTRSGGISFWDNTTAANASFICYGGVTGEGGYVQFYEGTNAGQAFFDVRAGALPARAGLVRFTSAASASGATFVTSGLVEFLHLTSAGSAKFTIIGGETRFLGDARGGDAQFDVFGPNSGPGIAGGTLLFAAAANAENSTIRTSGRLIDDAYPGVVVFREVASAGAASITNAAATVERASGLTQFWDSTTAGSATIANEGSGESGLDGGALVFRGTRAGSALITNKPAVGPGGAGGYTQFVRSSTTPATADAATIVTAAPTAAGQAGGFTGFYNSLAGNAVIVLEGSAVAGDSVVIFTGDSNAEQSFITAAGGTAAGGWGGHLVFADSSTAGSATLKASSGEVLEALGGEIFFEAQANGGSARAIVEAGALLDISALGLAGMPLGSLEGLGLVFLGEKNLAVGTNELNTTFGGVMQDGGWAGGSGGSLTKVGAGTLTLAGHNLYTGLTIVAQGTLCITGSVAGDVIVKPGAVLCLQGGTVGGPGRTITVEAGAQLTGSGVIHGTLINDGTVLAIGSEMLTLTGDVTNNGTMRFKSGAHLDASGATSFMNNGLLDYISGSANLPASFSNAPDGAVLDASAVKVESVARSGVNFFLTMAGYTGHSYQLQHASSLGAGSDFSDLGDPRSGNTGNPLVFEVQDPATHGFYLVIVD